MANKLTGIDYKVMKNEYYETSKEYSSVSQEEI